MCDKAVDDYAHALKFISDCYKTQEMCNKAVNCFFLFYCVLDQYKTQKSCDESVDGFW